MTPKEVYSHKGKVRRKILAELKSVGIVTGVPDISIGIGNVQVRTDEYKTLQVWHRQDRGWFTDAEEETRLGVAVLYALSLPLGSI